MKPQPKQEIVVQAIGDWKQRLEIYCASRDGLNWIFENAPQFGQLLDMREATGEIILHVSPLYDGDEVRMYLQTQGRHET